MGKDLIPVQTPSVLTCLPLWDHIFPVLIFSPCYSCHDNNWFLLMIQKYVLIAKCLIGWYKNLRSIALCPTNDTEPFLLHIVHIPSCSQQHFSLILSQALLITEKSNCSCISFVLWAPYYLHRFMHRHSSSPYTLICELLSQLGCPRLACPWHRQITFLRSELLTP